MYFVLGIDTFPPAPSMSGWIFLNSITGVACFGIFENAIICHEMENPTSTQGVQNVGENV